MARETWFGFNQKDLIKELRNLSADLSNPVRVAVPPETLVHIEDWALARRMVPCLIGRTYDHQKIGTGDVIFTSELFYLNEASGFARSFSRWYSLGKQVAPSYWETRGSKDQ